jgi:hypothetical protein
VEDGSCSWRRSAYRRQQNYPSAPKRLNLRKLVSGFFRSCQQWLDFAALLAADETGRKSLLTAFRPRCSGNEFGDQFLVNLYVIQSPEVILQDRQAVLNGGQTFLRLAAAV